MKRDLPKAYKDIHDDPHQMGGNFIIDVETFKILYTFKSKTPPDRPLCEELLKKLILYYKLIFINNFGSLQNQ